MESRRAALRLLDAALRRGLPLEAEVGPACAKLKRDADRGLAIAIAGEVLRRLPDYDALIDSRTKKNLPDDAKARMVLRIALAQALALDTPQHAAISTALPLLQGGPRRLAHGVFGALMRGEARLPEVPALPPRVADRWREAWDDTVVEAAAAAIAEPPPLDITLRDPDRTDHWCDTLGGRSLMPGHVRLPRRSIVDIPGYAEGEWWVQDIAASLPARLLGPGDDETTLDLCAAPGGKTLQLAAQGRRVTALDNSAGRLARVSENLDRTGLTADIVEADIFDWRPDAEADAVLLDAPCSATGIFRRHPDVIHRATDRIIMACAETQRAMLARAANWVRPGGRLVYAVCSLEPAEGETAVSKFLVERDDFDILPPEAHELPPGVAPTFDGFVRVLPGMIDDPGGADGFFIARFCRR